MKIQNKVVQSLIREENPFPSIFEYLTTEIWEPQEDITSYYEQDEDAKHFERFLQDTYFELYTEELPKHCSGSLQADLDHQTLILLDMLSLREGVLLKEHLRNNGYSVDLDYSFSAMPSTTKAFKKKINLQKKRKAHKYKKINDFQGFSLDGDENFIWSSFPDEWLEEIQKGKKIRTTEEEVYQKTLTHLKEILAQLEDDEEIVLTSDHGYNVAKGAYQFSLDARDQKKIKEVMGNSRSIQNTNVEADKLVDAGFLVEYDEYLMAQSRNIWPIRGSYSVYQHGGASLLECMIPKLTIKNGDTV